MYLALNLIAVWLPRTFFGLIFVLAVWVYVRLRRGMGARSIGLRGLAVASVAFKFVYAAFLTIGQYFVWKSDPFTTLLLGSAPGAAGYFAAYSWSRFWVDAVWSVVLAFIFWVILKSLEKHNGRFFHPGETELGFIAALIVGWPDMLLFVPLVFLSVVLVSIFRLVFLKERYTTLGWPLLLAALLAVAVGHFFGSAIGLSSWEIY